MSDEWTTVHRCALCNEATLGSVRGSYDLLNLSLIEIVATGAARSPMVNPEIHDCSDGRHGLAPIIGIAPATTPPQASVADIPGC